MKTKLTFKDLSVRSTDERIAKLELEARLLKIRLVLKSVDFDVNKIKAIKSILG